MTNDERMQRESTLIATIRRSSQTLQGCSRMMQNWCYFTKTRLPPTFEEDEYTLLGMAIKYAGLRGKEVRVIGKNRSSLGEEDKIQ